jgi:hypothetical protein
VQRCLGADGQRPPEVLGVLLEQAVPRRCAGVVDEHVDRADGVVDLLEGRLDLLRRREVGGDGDGLAVGLPGEPSGEVLQVGRRPGEQRDRAALLGEALGQDSPRPGPRPAITAVRAMPARRAARERKHPSAGR